MGGDSSSSILGPPGGNPAALRVNPADIPALEIKLGALVVLLSVTLLFGVAPLCIVRGTGRFSLDPGRGPLSPDQSQVTSNGSGPRPGPRWW